MDLQLRMVQAAVEAQLFGETTHPVQVGRYTVQGPIGTGGMGSVVRAFDPELQREVALKLLRAERMGDATTRARLVQEARAMARLAHPNVAMVFEVGEADGHLFVAMELIDGRDLRAWLDEGPRPWREILDMFLQAGQGLVAAHAKGLIHRDFKPENVVVDAEGRARVVDFGLAREQGEAITEDDDGALRPSFEPDPEPEPDGTSSTAPTGGHRAHDPRRPVDLTTTGTLLGTPAYMSPEQWAGRTVDARSDQFSFCVALWEALYRQRPFPGEDMGSLMASVASGRIADPRPGPVPNRLRRALERGLQIAADARWPDMASLLAALQPPGRRRWLAASAATVAVAGLGAMVLIGTAPSDACRDERDRLREVWDPSAREAAERGVLATDLPYAADVWRGVSNRLDGYADEWTALAEVSCAGALTDTEAARTRHALQQSCLEDARTLLDQLADQLAEADEATVVDAANAATRLPDLSACTDDRRLVQWSQREDPHHAELVQRAREELNRARRALAVIDTATGATQHEAELAAGQRAATQARDDAEQAGHHALVAEASLALGRALLRIGDKQAAERALTVSMEQAEVAGDALTRLRARIYQIYVLGNDRDRTGEAIRLGEQSLAQLDGLGDRPLLRARLLGNLATAVAKSRRPDHARALELHREAIALLRDEVGEHHPNLITAQLNYGRALAYAHQYEAAETELRAALTRAQRVWGEDHPNTARIWGTLGLTLADQGHMDEAEPALRRSLTGRERSLGPEHQDVAGALYNLGIALRRADRHDEAIPLLRRGLAIRRRLSRDDNNLIPWLHAIGASELARGRHAAAREALREALSLAETDGASPIEFARVRFELAQATAPDDPTAARVLAQTARDTFAVEGQTARAAEIDEFLVKLDAP